MRRRDFLLRLTVAVPAITAMRAWTNELQPTAGWRTFELTTHVDPAKPSGRTHLWLPVPLSQATGYQRTLETRWDAPGASHAEQLTLTGHDVELLRIEWPDETSVGRVTVVSRVATRDRCVDLARAAASGKGTACDGESRLQTCEPADPPESSSTLRHYMRPTVLLPTDGIVRKTAERITRGRRRDIDKARAIYEWVVDNTNRDPRIPGCGIGDVASMLKSGYLGGKCADINALFVALARAAQIPARDAYGIRIADSRLGFKSLGRSGDVSKAQHCRAEFYAAGHGWVPVDPADVRKVVLEEEPGGLPMSHPKVRSARERLFGCWEMNWLAYNHGHDIALPGSDGAAIPFLMYPQGETTEGRVDSLDAAGFRYEIRSRELTA